MRWSAYDENRIVREESDRGASCKSLLPSNSPRREEKLHHVSKGRNYFSLESTSRTSQRKKTHLNRGRFELDHKRLPSGKTSVPDTSDAGAKLAV